MSARAARLRGLLGWASLLGVYACSSGDSGPGNLLASRGACDTAPFGTDPACVCCGEHGAGCYEGAPCAPEGASEVCGARCPSTMVCNPVALVSGAGGRTGACQVLRKAGEECGRWGNGGTSSNCASGLACVPGVNRVASVCAACTPAGASCAGGDASSCCPCPGGASATCAAGTCTCEDGGSAWTPPACPADSGYPCACTGTTCADGAPCVKFQKGPGICSRGCVGSGASTCGTAFAAPDASPSCALHLAATGGGAPFDGCAVACTSSAQCPEGLACRDVTAGRICLP